MILFLLNDYFQFLSALSRCVCVTVCEEEEGKQGALLTHSMWEREEKTAETLGNDSVGAQLATLSDVRSYSLCECCYSSFLFVCVFRNDFLKFFWKQKRDEWGATLASCCFCQQQCVILLPLEINQSDFQIEYFFFPKSIGLCCVLHDVGSCPSSAKLLLVRILLYYFIAAEHLLHPDSPPSSQFMNIHKDNRKKLYTISHIRAVQPEANRHLFCKKKVQYLYTSRVVGEQPTMIL